MAEESPDSSELERDLATYYAQLSPAERRNRLWLHPAFRDPYNEIIEAPREVRLPWYFWAKWAPFLGPVASMVYVALRRHCYFNQKASAASGRSGFSWPGQGTLAAEIGIKDREAIRRALKLLEEHGFIRRWRDPNADQRDPITGRLIRRATDTYEIYWEIPLIARDAVRLLLRQAGTSATSRPSSAEVTPTQLTPVENHRVADRPPVGDVHAADEPSHGQNLADTLSEPRENHHASAGILPGTSYSQIERNQRYVGLGTHSKPEDSSTENQAAPEAIHHTLHRRFPRKVRPPEKHLADVLPQIAVSSDKGDELLRIEDLSTEMLRQLRDSQSLPFYRLVARRFLAAGLDRLVYQVLAEVKEGDEGGLLRNRAAAFTARIKTLAAAHGVGL